MSIYIKDMEMPTKKNAVILITPNGDVWMIGNMPNEDTHLVKAKAISTPQHGRLIDADALLNNKSIGTQIARLGKMYHETCIEYAPTVIPANKEK